MLRSRYLPLVVCVVITGCSSQKEDNSARERAPDSASSSAEFQGPSDGGAEVLPLVAEEVITPEVVPLLPVPPSSRTALGPSSASPPTSRSPFWTVKVFYGTNRARSGSELPANFFDGRLSDLTYGACDVSVPRTHQPGELESPSIWRLEFRADPRKHVTLLRLRPQSGRDFMNELQQEIWDSMRCLHSADGPTLTGGEAFIFVHGYSNSFEDAARRTAQIAYDLKFQGAPIMFSWPSKGKWSLESYRDDSHAVVRSRQVLVEFVRQVARDSGARRIHLIAHSMGNRVVTEALAHLASDPVSFPIPKFNEIILTAPDIDAREFKDVLAPRITQAAERITIYSSSSDRALQASAWLNALNHPRLGDAGRRLTVFPEHPNIDVVDASYVATDLFGFNHSYHADNPTVLYDISLVLAGYTAEQRGLAAILGDLAWQIRSLGGRISSGVSNVGAVRK